MFLGKHSRCWRKLATYWQPSLNSGKRMPRTVLCDGLKVQDWSQRVCVCEYCQYSNENQAFEESKLWALKKGLGRIYTTAPKRTYQLLSQGWIAWRVDSVLGEIAICIHFCWLLNSNSWLSSHEWPTKLLSCMDGKQMTRVWDSFLWCMHQKVDIVCYDIVQYCVWITIHLLNWGADGSMNSVYIYIYRINNATRLPMRSKSALCNHSSPTKCVVEARPVTWGFKQAEPGIWKIGALSVWFYHVLCFKFWVYALSFFVNM